MSIHLPAHSWRNKKGSATLMWRHLAARPPVPERERRVTRIHPLWQLAIWQPRGLYAFFFQTQTFRIARTRKTYSIEVFVRKLLEDGLHYICLCIFAGFGFTVFVRKLLWSRDLHTCRGGNTNDLLHLINHETILFNFQRHRWLELREYRETTSLPSLAEEKSPIRLLGLNGRSRRSTNSSTTNNEGARAVFNQSSDCLKCPRQCYIYNLYNVILP